MWGKQTLKSSNISDRRASALKSHAHDHWPRLNGRSDQEIAVIAVVVLIWQTVQLSGWVQMVMMATGTRDILFGNWHSALQCNDDNDDDEEEGVRDCDKRMFFQSSFLYGLDDCTYISISQSSRTVSIALWDDPVRVPNSWIELGFHWSWCSLWLPGVKVHFGTIYESG